MGLTSILLNRQERGNQLLRWFDTWIGIPLVFFLGLLRIRNRIPAGFQPRRIGVLATAAIGDSVVLSGILQDLKLQFPKAKLIVFTGKNNFETFGFFPFIDEVSLISIRNPLKAIATLRRAGSMDVFIDSGQWARLNAVLTFFARSTLKIGFETKKQYRHYAFDIPVRHRNDVHEIENFRNLVRPLGVKGVSIPRIDVGPRQKKRQVAVHMFASGIKPELKQWPLEYWPPVIDELCRRGYQVIMTGVNSDRPFAESVREKCAQKDQVVNLAGSLRLRETAERLSECELVITTNTGIMHLAAAVGCRLITLEGPVSPLRWGPVTELVTVVQSKLPCSPCLYLGFDFGCPVNNCMRSIEPSRVLNAFKEGGLT